MFWIYSEIVQDVAVLPGISDHKIVTASLMYPQLFRAQDTERKVYMYDKGNFEAIETGLSESLGDFERFALSNGLDAIWAFFKNCLLKLIEKYVPVEIVRAKAMNDKPWMTVAVKNVIKKRRRGY